MNLSMRRSLDEICVLCGIPQEMIVRFIQEEWILPVDEKNQFLDEEDLARINLILDLQERFGVNDEAIPLILHLVDQINTLELRLKDFIQEK